MGGTCCFFVFFYYSIKNFSWSHLDNVFIWFDITLNVNKLYCFKWVKLQFEYRNRTGKSKISNLYKNLSYQTHLHMTLITFLFLSILSKLTGICQKLFCWYFIFYNKIVCRILYIKKIEITPLSLFSEKFQRNKPTLVAVCVR